MTDADAKVVATALVTTWLQREKHWLDGGSHIHQRARDSLIHDIAGALRTAAVTPEPPLPAKKPVKKGKATAD